MNRTELKRDPAAIQAWREKSRHELKRQPGNVRRVRIEYARPTSRRAGASRQPDYWHGEILDTVCVVCLQRPATEGHHIVRVQVLRAEAQKRGYRLADVLWDRRNRLGVCTDCHANHHGRARPISRAVLERVASWVFRFAEELDLEWVLDREYSSPAAAA